MRDTTLAAVVEKLGVDAPTPDLRGLRSVYAAWCRAVPFDNTLKMIHMTEGRTGPLPGSTAEAFFEAWLRLGTGGTCWAGNGALHDLLEALGFDVTRAIATMLSSPEHQDPNHGSVIATVAGERWIVDASILSGEPIRIPEPGEPVGAGPLPRFTWLDGSPAVTWQTPSARDGFQCRFERSGADAADWDVRHQRTRAWSPFNTELSVRIMRDGSSIGISNGERFTFGADGVLSTSVLDRDARLAFLVDEIGIAKEVAAGVPDDVAAPPRP